MKPLVVALIAVSALVIVVFLVKRAKNNINKAITNSVCDTSAYPPKDAPAPKGTTWVNDHYESDSNSAAWIYPMWNCKTNSYDYTSACSDGSNFNCPIGQTALCEESTSYQWKCIE